MYRGKEAEWKPRIKVKLGARLLLDIVNRAEVLPEFLKDIVFEDTINCTPVKNLAINFEAIQTSSGNRTEKARR